MMAAASVKFFTMKSGGSRNIAAEPQPNETERNLTTNER
jgi:hypothetical protein